MTESVNSALENELVSKYLPLIKWASRKYSMRAGDSRYFQTFYDRGVDTLCICFNKWNTQERFRDRFNSEQGIKEFGKYFKTALFTNFLQSQIEISKKSKFVFMNIDELLEKKSIRTELLSYLGVGKKQYDDKFTYDGFSEIRYEELLREVEVALQGLELAIFRILIEPPPRLNEQILRENARRMRYFDITGVKVKGLDSVRITKGHIFRYLNSNVKKISSSEFNKSMKKVKSAVLEVCVKKK
jgi:hypothetical protein